jgi:AcrR family transcriptional regulator
VSEPVKRQRTDPRIRRTERAVIEAARSLFEGQGYAATTMTQIAARAECAERTLFLRFHTKAELLMKVVDETFRGPLEPEDAVPGWVVRSRAATTLDARLGAFAEGVAEILVRTGPLFGVAREAEASEPLIAAAFDAARRETMANIDRMWRQLADDGLLHPNVDVQWAAETTGLLAGADTYLLISKTLSWSRDDLAAWLHRTWTHFATTPSPPVASPDPLG